MVSSCSWQVAGPPYSVGRGGALLIQSPLNQAQVGRRVLSEPPELTGTMVC